MFISQLKLKKLIGYYDWPRIFTAKFNKVHYIFYEYDDNIPMKWVACKLKIGDLYKLSHGKIALQDLYKQRECFIADDDHGMLMPLNQPLLSYFVDEPIYFNEHFHNFTL